MKLWPKKPLSEITSCLDSQRIPIKEDERQKRPGSVPYYGANGQVGWIDKAIFDEPLLLIAEDGGHFNEPQKGVAYTIHGPSWVNNHAHVLRPDESKVSLDFIGYYYRHFDFLPYITGTTRAKLTQHDLMRVETPIPPLLEQKRIVKLLDEADELRKLRAQADRRTSDLIPALFHEMFGDPTHIEKMRWTFKPLGEIAKVSYGLADKLDAATKPENGARILTISNVLLDGLIDTQVEKYSVVDTDERAKAHLQKYDLLFNWRNGSETHVGKTAIWEEQLEGEILHVSFLLKVRPDQNKVNPYFLWALINRLRATGYFMRNARMQINRKFNASELSALKLPLPPLPLQNEFAKRVTEIRAMDAEQTVSRHKVETLFQSVLSKAFEGEL